VLSIPVRSLIMHFLGSNLYRVNILASKVHSMIVCTLASIHPLNRECDQMRGLCHFRHHYLRYESKVSSMYDPEYIRLK
jgi:hypothetical protein